MPLAEETTSQVLRVSKQQKWWGKQKAKARGALGSASFAIRTSRRVKKSPSECDESTRQSSQVEGGAVGFLRPYKS